MKSSPRWLGLLVALRAKRVSEARCWPLRCGAGRRVDHDRHAPRGSASLGLRHRPVGASRRALVVAWGGAYASLRDSSSSEASGRLITRKRARPRARTVYERSDCSPLAQPMLAASQDSSRGHAGALFDDGS